MNVKGEITMKKLTSLLLAATMIGGAVLSPMAAEEAKASEEVIKIMSVGTETDAYTTTMRELAEEFSANNEYGVTVEFELYENEQFKTKLTTLMASNEVPDVFFTWELGYLEPFVSAGKVMSLQEALDTDAEWKGSFVDGILDYYTYDGEVYAIPSQIAYATMFYNKDIFAQYDLEVPTTYEEFLNVCTVLKENGITPIAMEASEAWVPAQFVLQLALGIGGGDTYNAIMNGEEVWNNEVYVEAAADFQEMVNNGWFSEGMLAMSYDEAIMEFEAEEAGMYYMASWDASGFVVDRCPIKDSVGSFNIPGKIEAGQNCVVGSADTAYALSAECSNPEACIAFLKYITSQDWQYRDLMTNAKIPTVKLEADQSEMGALVADIVNNMEPITVYPWWDRAFGSGEGEEFNNACLAIAGGEDVQETLDNLQTIIEINSGI